MCRSSFYTVKLSSRGNFFLAEPARSPALLRPLDIKLNFASPKNKSAHRRNRKRAFVLVFFFVFFFVGLCSRGRNQLHLFFAAARRVTRSSRFRDPRFFRRPSAAHLLTGNSANIRETLNGLFGDRHGGGRDFGGRSAVDGREKAARFSTETRSFFIRDSRGIIVRRVLRSLLPAGAVAVVVVEFAHDQPFSHDYRY